MNIYDVCHDAGGMTAYEWERDPKRLAFILARYTFVAKMFAGKGEVLEVGCADGYGSRIVRQAVSNMVAIDIDAQSIGEARRMNYSARWPITYSCVDVMELDLPSYDATFALDVIEHIERRKMSEFLNAMHRIARVCIIGTPSLESQQYASELSKQGHINCMSGERLRTECAKHWSQVFMFGMNDSVLHTGFLPMSHYLFALCVR